jgi:hypothetical protein
MSLLLLQIERKMWMIPIPVRLLMLLHLVCEELLPLVVVVVVVVIERRGFVLYAVVWNENPAMKNRMSRGSGSVCGMKLSEVACDMLHISWCLPEDEGDDDTLLLAGFVQMWQSAPCGFDG